MSTECPHCGKSTELLLAAPPDEPTVPRRTIVWTMVAVLILCAGLGGVMLALRRTENWAPRRKEHSAPTNSMAAADSSAPKQANSRALNPWGETGFGVSGINLERTSGSSLVYAVGTITNLTDRQRFGVRVELDLLDNSDKKMGTARDYQQVIESNGRWQFRALVMDSKATGAKIASIKEDE